MAGGGSGREQNFWPGFVDALTNLVLVMVFVVVVFTVALFYFTTLIAKNQIDTKSQTAKAEAQAIYQEKVDEAHKSMDQMSQQIKQLSEENKQLQESAVSDSASNLKRPQEIDVDRVQQTEDKAHPPAFVSGKGPVISINFAPGATDLTPELFERLDAGAGSYADAGKWEIDLTAEPAEASYSEGRRLAYYRIVVLRNHFIEKGVRAGAIHSIIGPAQTKLTRSRVVVRLRAP